MISYIENISETPPSRVRALLEPLNPAWEEGYMTTIEMMRAEVGAEERAEGQAEGRAEMLMILLAARFGPVPDDVAGDVRGAGSDQLRDWLTLAATANSLDEVFPRRKGS